MKEITLDFLKKNYKKIHSFGLGFIQIKLNEEERVHIYCPEVQVTTGEEEIHNHRYGFISHIIKGELTNIIYEINNNDTHILIDESCDPARPKSPQKPKPCGINKLATLTSKKGSFYHLDKNTYHQVETKRCVTYLKREQPSKDFAQVVFKKNNTTTCPFSVKMTEEELWKIVDQELKANY